MAQLQKVWNSKYKFTELSACTSLNKLHAHGARLQEYDQCTGSISKRLRVGSIVGNIVFGSYITSLTLEELDLPGVCNTRNAGGSFGCYLEKLKLMDCHLKSGKFMHIFVVVSFFFISSSTY